MSQKVLSYDKSIVPQERFYDCGPASAQVILDSLGITVSEDELIREIGTTENGTDYVGLIERYLDRKVPNAKYTSVYLENDPPTQAQKDALWRNLTNSIDAGYGVIMNWVSPPGNRPRAIKGSEQPNYGWNTVFHYVPAVGYSDDGGERAVYIADSGFRPFGYWVPFDGPGSAASLIPPKGYCYANITPAEVKVPPPVAPKVNRSRDGNALAIINEGRRARSGEGQLDHPVISERGIKIALATALVESNLLMYANYGDPASLSFPHDAISQDANSTGLFQQRDPWWGTVADRMDAARSAALFYNALAKRPYNDVSRSPGSFAQDVQRSAFPARYDEKFAEAAALYDRLAGAAPAPTEEVVMTTGQRLPSRSPLRRLGEGLVDNETGMLLNCDGNLHVLLVKTLAEIGDPGALTVLAEVAAADLSRYPDRKSDAALAQRILAHIEATNPAVLAQFLRKG